MNKPNFYLARALYIPAMVLIVFGVYCLCTNQVVFAGMAGVFGTMLGLLGFIAALKSSGHFKPTGILVSGD